MTVDYNRIRKYLPTVTKEKKRKKVSTLDIAQYVTLYSDFQSTEN